MNSYPNIAISIPEAIALNKFSGTFGPVSAYTALPNKSKAIMSSRKFLFIMSI